MFRCTGSFLKLLVKGQKVVWKRTSFDSYFWSTFSSAESDVFRSSSKMYGDCLRKNSRFFISTASGYAKTKYKMQNCYDRLVHGKKEKAAAQVAFMITKEMKQGLSDLGFDSKAVSNLKPAYAQYIIRNSISSASWKEKEELYRKKCDEEEQEARRKAEEAAEKARKEAEEEARKKAEEEAKKTSDPNQPVTSSEDVSAQQGAPGLVLVKGEEDSAEFAEQPKPSLMVVEDKEKSESL